MESILILKVDALELGDGVQCLKGWVSNILRVKVLVICSVLSSWRDSIVEVMLVVVWRVIILVKVGVVEVIVNVV